MERRTGTRVPFSIDALIRWGERSVRGTLLNISLSGMYIDIAEKIPLHASIAVEISLESGGTRIACTLPGEVVRSDPKGAAIRLARMNLDSYIALRDLMMNHAKDPRSIMDEFHLFISENRIRQRP